MQTEEREREEKLGKRRHTDPQRHTAQKRVDKKTEKQFKEESKKRREHSKPGV